MSRYKPKKVPPVIIDTQHDMEAVMVLNSKVWEVLFPGAPETVPPDRIYIALRSLKSLLLGLFMSAGDPLLVAGLLNQLKQDCDMLLQHGSLVPKNREIH